jgi:outer membrane scaffolding protein for murein synthesis (MipA/OmpV family)
MNNNKINKFLFPQFSLAAIMFAGASLSSASYANDIAHKLRDARGEQTTTENYFELGLGLATGIAPSLTDDDDKWAGGYAVVNGNYTWNNLFIEKYGESGEGLILGYNAYESENWSLDLVVGPKFRGLNFDDKFNDLDERNTSAMLGGRLTGYLGDKVLQFTLKHDISGSSEGTLASALVGRNWQVRNWNFHGLVGVHFFDSKINDYYYGVSEAEASRTQFTEYQPGSNVNFSAEAGVTYPISEKWVFRSTVRFSSVSDEDMNSPLFETTRSTKMSLSTSVSYVF